MKPECARKPIAANMLGTTKRDLVCPLLTTRLGYRAVARPTTETQQRLYN